MSTLHETIRLIAPDASWREEFISYCEEFRDAGEHVVHGQLAEATADFVGLVCRWADNARGANLAAGQVPYNVYWLVRGCRILGTARFRHSLNESTSREGGHIGYEIRASERRKGLATRMLSMVLEKAREKGLPRVLLTCQKDNSASVKTIGKNGGVLECEFVSKRTGNPALRYWIDLRKIPRR